jgi:hypothetical protein
MVAGDEDCALLATRSGAAPKTAQILARHSDINLTMNTYTMLGVMDQAAAVEALPPIPTSTDNNEPSIIRATGTDGSQFEVPSVVPRGAENGARRLASNALQMHELALKGRNRAAQRTRKLPRKTLLLALIRTSLHRYCERRELNPHPFRDRILSPARLPIPPLSREFALPTVTSRAR